MDLTETINRLNLAGNEVPSIVDNFAAVIEENHTEFLVLKFQNRQIIIATQFGKIGNLYSVVLDTPDNGLPTGDPVYNIFPLLGGENIEVLVAVRYLAGKLNLRRPALVCLTLKNYKRETVDTVAKIFLDFYKNKEQ